MRARQFTRVQAWDPHPAEKVVRWPRSGRKKEGGQKTSIDAEKLAQKLRKVSALLQVGIPAQQAWQEVSRVKSCGEGECDEWGIPREVITQAGEHSRSIRAACGISTVLGAPLAQVLDCLADSFDDLHEAQEARRIAGAGPALSAKILNLLPVVALLAVSVMGINPFPVLADGGAGTACGIVGLAFLLAGRWVSVSMIRASQRRWDEDGSEDTALVCDLIAAALDAGASIPRALECLGRCSDREELSLVSKRLTVGLEWELAWEDCPEQYLEVAEVLREAWMRGAAVDEQLRRFGATARKKRLTDARAGAEELGVRLVVPLGLLMLPAFICLGVVPVLITLAHSAI